MATRGMRKIKLKDVCDRITVGHVGPMADKYAAEGVPFLRSQNITAFRLNLEDIKYIPSEFHDKLRKSALRAGDVAVVRTGYPGTACVIPDKFPELNCADLVVITPSKELSPYYLAAIFNSAWGVASVAGNLVGVAQQHFNVGAAREMEISLPPRLTQDRIAGILSAYDELIENSQRRIRILESMARALYREWFVHFRFPGHENHPHVASLLGEIPEGWEVKPFTEVADVLSGGTPKTDVAAYWNGEIPFFTPRDAPSCFYVQDAEKHVTELGLSKCASELYSPDTVFITARGTVGKVALPSVPMAMNQSCYALRGKSGVPQRYLFLLTLHQVDYLKTNTGGATFDTIVVDTFRRMQVVKPPRPVIDRFAGQVDAMFEQVNALQRQVQNLRRTRDLLLPRLLSGQVDVEAA